MGNRIDVIIPAHRTHATLGRALESLAAQDVAVDLLCDNGTERTAAIGKVLHHFSGRYSESRRVGRLWTRLGNKDWRLRGLIKMRQLDARS